MFAGIITLPGCVVYYVLLRDCVSDSSSRDNSQSSTDTASFPGSSQGSCPPSAEKVKLEPLEIVENGIFAHVLLHSVACAVEMLSRF